VDTANRGHCGETQQQAPWIQSAIGTVDTISSRQFGYSQHQAGGYCQQ
jgi:hypothetical protein